MATLNIEGIDYPSYDTVDFADDYLAGDVLRAAGWAARVIAGDKERALVSATRLLQRQSWKDAVPDIDAPPLEVQQATALLAADIATNPALGDSGSTSSNVKSVGAGSAKVDFFRPVDGYPLPSAAFALLRDLLGVSSALTDPALDNTAYGSSDCYPSRFDPRDYDTSGRRYRWPEELW